MFPRLNAETEGAGGAAMGDFLKRRVRPVAQKLGIRDRLVTFQVTRRTP